MDFTGIGVLAGIAAAACGVGLYYNRLMALDQRCATAFSDVDVQLKHRHSVLPGLIETVRGYSGHERSVIEKVTHARAQALRATTNEERLSAEGVLGQSITSLLIAAENYPNLKASSHFAGLRSEIVDVENRITAARRFYNLAVEEFNTTLRQFPGNVIGSYFRLGQRRNFDLGIERVLNDEAVAIKF